MSPTFRDDAVHVRVPATSANLGPGFDSLGLALTIYDDLTARVRGEGLTIDVSGQGEAVARDETHLVVRSMRAAFDRLGGQPSGLELSCLNRIPHGRGMGSSAAAIVAGILLARALVVGGDEAMPDASALALAATIEGHPDNVAACLLGGLTIAWTEGETARALHLSTGSTVVPVAFIPPYEALTAQVRGLLPETVPHCDAAFTAGRSALLVAALSTAPEAVFAATEDRLHQPYRAPAMPEAAELVARLRTAGLAGVVSGAGPSVLVLARGDLEVKSAGALCPAGWRWEVLGVDPAGARVAPPGMD